MKKSLLAGISVALTLALFVKPGQTDEGMFPLDGVQSWPVDQMKQAGLQVTPEQLLGLKHAMARVARGGSGSFVSAKGLLITNHHVAYGCIAKLDGTDKHKGIMEKGFVAGNLSEELPCPGYDLLVVDGVRDVTADVRKAIPAHASGHPRFEAIRRAKDRLEDACQREKKGNICEVEALDGGRFYHLVIYRRIRDVRLVYAPEEDIGRFGGEEDNWMYPRHTGDFTFLRAYVDSSGNEAPFDAENIPFEPPVYLKVSRDGLKKGDMVIAMGFPARTKRNFPRASAEFTRDIEMSERLRIYQEILNMLKELGQGDDLTARRYQSLVWGLGNGLKYAEQLLAGFEQWRIVEKKREQEEAFKKSLQDNPQALKKFEQLLREIDKAYDTYRNAFKRHMLLGGLIRVSRAMSTAYHIARWTEERGKKDADRKDAEYKDKNVYEIFDASDSLDDEVTMAGERALLTYILKESEKLPKSAQILAAKQFIKWGRQEAERLKNEAKRAKKTYEEYYKELTSEAPAEDAVVTAVVLALSRTALLAHRVDRDESERALFQRRRLFYHDPGKTRRFRDPLLDFARAVVKEKEKIENGPYRAIEETFDTELRPRFAELMNTGYPDANAQIRMTYGRVDDYTAAKDGKTHHYITDLKGALAKDKGKPPFRVPAKLKKAATADKGRFVDRVIGDVPIAFTSTLDSTGGNSGSPVLDGRGRLIGVLFDGTPESILSDWQFLPDNQRTISVDIRYPLFLAEKVHQAQHLLSEMGL